MYSNSIQIRIQNTITPGLMLSGDRIAFDSRRCDIIFPMKSVQTTYSSKGDVSYLYEGKTKELSRERERERAREREREREFAMAMRFGYS